MKFDEGIPIYLQIKEMVENAIISGSLQEEEAIPSIRTLAREYLVNPQTISSAVNELLSEDIVFKKRGIGMFVQKGAKAHLIQNKMSLFTSKELVNVVKKGKALGLSLTEFKEILNKIYEQGEK